MGSADKLNNVVVDISCELGRKEMTLKEVRQLEVQDVVELDRLAGEAFEIRMNGKLFGSFFTLESILPRLGQQSYVRTSRVDQDELRNQNRQRLRKMQVPVRAELARGQLTLGEARRLQVGDVLCADTEVDEPAMIYVNQEPKYLARPCRDKDRMRAMVVGEIPPKEEFLCRNRSKPVID